MLQKNRTKKKKKKKIIAKKSFSAKSAWASPFNVDHVRLSCSKNTRRLASELNQTIKSNAKLPDAASHLPRHQCISVYTDNYYYHYY